MSVTLYGASDDLVLVEGDVDEEFTAGKGADDLVAFSDGTLLRINYDQDGVWRINPLVNGRAALSVQQAPANDEDNYSDRATLDGEIAWVVLGDRSAMSASA